MVRVGTWCVGGEHTILLFTASTPPHSIPSPHPRPQTNLLDITIFHSSILCHLRCSLSSFPAPPPQFSGRSIGIVSPIAIASIPPPLPAPPFISTLQAPTPSLIPSSPLPPAPLLSRSPRIPPPSTPTPPPLAAHNTTVPQVLHYAPDFAIHLPLPALTLPLDPVLSFPSLPLHPLHERRKGGWREEGGGGRRSVWGKYYFLPMLVLNKFSLHTPSIMSPSFLPTSPLLLSHLHYRGYSNGDGYAAHWLMLNRLWSWRPPLTVLDG